MAIRFWLNMASGWQLNPLAHACCDVEVEGRRMPVEWRDCQ